MGFEFVIEAEGAAILRFGVVPELLTTLNVVEPEVARALFPTESWAVLAPIMIPKDPFPVMLEMVIVLVLVPLPDTLTTPLAVPVLLSVISELLRVIEEAPV